MINFLQFRGNKIQGFDDRVSGTYTCYGWNIFYLQSIFLSQYSVSDSKTKDPG